MLCQQTKLGPQAEEKGKGVLSRQLGFFFPVRVFSAVFFKLYLQLIIQGRFSVPFKCFFPFTKYFLKASLYNNQSENMVVPSLSLSHVLA